MRNNPFPRPNLDWDFVEAHYPDYYHCNIICQSGDMSACFEFTDLDSDEVITKEAIGRLKALAPDRFNSREPSYQQVQAFSDYIGSGLTFGQAQQQIDDYCLAKAVLNCPADAAVLSAETLKWAQVVLNDWNNEPLFHVVVTNKNTGRKTVVSNPLTEQQGYTLRSKMMEHDWRMITVERFFG
ncbi:hypothetical protein [Neisseria arctica]|uniref:hypothetical protein n=1 Tax=Neisseria arctica TaxID=1470200 RepID=UPI00069A9E8E|nr:hypothetical protein [Neisseria arctica]UOO85684.1 hypothetical protein LVJ86_05430 [Neisseria arctica]